MTNTPGTSALRRHWRAAALYAGLLLACAGVSVMAWSDVFDAAESLSRATDARDRLRLGAGNALSRFSVPPPPGSPFIDGATAALAGAALQGRVLRAVEEAGGIVLSSQTTLPSAQAGDGRVALVVSGEFGQDSLQKALYDLESGSPVLVVERLTVRAQTADGAASPRLRVELDVSGRRESAP